MHEKGKLTLLFKDIEEAEKFGKGATLTQILQLQKLSRRYEKVVNSLGNNLTPQQLNQASVYATNREFILKALRASPYNVGGTFCAGGNYD